MLKSQSSISVYDYTDYRKYLLDYYQDQKSKNRSFSYRFFSRKAAINSIGLYKDVVDGRQSLGRSLILKFSQALGLGLRENEYFEQMVYFNEAKTVEERKAYFGRMIACCESKAFRVDADRYEYYSRWYYSAIRALITCHPFVDDYDSLAKALNPAIRPAQAKQAVKILEKLEFIVRNKMGYWQLNHSVISSGVLSEDQRINGLNIVNFQKSMMTLASEAFERHPFEQLSMSTLTLSLSKGTFLRFKEEISVLRKKFAHLAESDKSPDRVYQLNYQFFPLSRIDESARSGK